MLDADRIRATGAPAVRINTGSGCHFDAQMLAGGLQMLDPPDNSVVLIETSETSCASHCPEVLQLSATIGDGIDGWYGRLRAHLL